MNSTLNPPISSLRAGGEERQSAGSEAAEFPAAKSSSGVVSQTLGLGLVNLRHALRMSGQLSLDGVVAR
jgi:hypothetical protein